MTLSLEQRRFLLSLLIGLLLTLFVAEVHVLFRGAALTPLLSQTANLPGTLFANLFGRPRGATRGIWRTLILSGNLIAYTFLAYIAIAIGTVRSR